MSNNQNNQNKAVTLINLGGSSVMRNCTIVDSGLSVTNDYCKEWSALRIASGATVQNVVIAGVTNTVDGSAVLPTGTVAKFANGAVDGDISELAFPEGTITGVKYSREEAAVAAAKLGHLKQARRRAGKRIRCCR